MINVGDVVIKVGLDLSPMEADLQKIKGQFEGLGNKLATQQLTKIGAGITAFGAAVTASLGMAVKAAASEEVGIIRLTQALKNVGVSYDDVKDSLEANIAATQKKTAVSDHDQRNALAWLVGVTNDYNKALKVMPLVLDLAAAKQMDVASAAMVIGRVVMGDTAILGRYGIQLKANATTQEALAALQQKFGGQAEAYGKSTAGAIQKIKNSIADFMESFGKILLPTVKAMANVLSTVISWLGKLPGPVKAAAVIAAVLAAALALLGGSVILLVAKLPWLIAQWASSSAVMTMATVRTIAQTVATTALAAAQWALNAALAAFTSPVTLVIAGIAGIGYAIYRMFHQTSALQQYVKDLQKQFKGLKDASTEALDAIDTKYDTLIAKATNAGDTQTAMQLEVKKATERLREQSQTIAVLNAIYQALTKSGRGTSDIYIKMKNEIDALSLSLENEKTSIDDLVKSYQTLALQSAQNLKDWEDLVAEYYKAIADAQAAHDKAVADEATRYAKAQSDATRTMLSDIAEANRSYFDQEQALTKNYEDQLKQRTDALYDWRGLFEKMPEWTYTSGKALMRSLQNQVKWFEVWQDNINKLAAKVPEGMVDDLRKLGPDALPQLEALNSMTADQLKDYVALWTKKKELTQNEATKELAGLKADTDRQLSNLYDVWVKSLDDIVNYYTLSMGEAPGGIRYFNNENFAALGPEIARALADINSGVITPGLAESLRIHTTALGEIATTWGTSGEDLRQVNLDNLAAIKADTETAMAAVDPSFIDRFRTWVNAAIQAGIDIPAGLIAGLTAAKPNLFALVDEFNAKMTTMLTTQTETTAAALAAATAAAAAANAPPPPVDVTNLTPYEIYQNQEIFHQVLPIETALYPEGQGPGSQAAAAAAIKASGAGSWHPTPWGPAFWQHGGLITEPTLLWGLRSMRPYAVAGEAGVERVSPVAGAGARSTTITNHFEGPWFIREEADINRIARELYRLQETRKRKVGV